MVKSGRYWRAVRPSRAAKMWSGEGGLFADSRWLPKGHPIVYLADSPSLAVLEQLVNAPKPWPRQLVFASVDLPFPAKPDATVDRVDLGKLPTNWRELPREPGPLWDLGLTFMNSSHFGLLVPSAVVTLQSNLIVKVAHPAFADLVAGASTAALHDLDTRLVDVG